MKLPICFLISAVASYEVEWQEFQDAQGARNEAMPEAFKQTVDLVKEHNSQDHTWRLTYTGPFAAMSPAEYKQRLGYKPKSPHGSNIPLVGSHTNSGQDDDEVDWTTKGAVTPVKDQGNCGSCWAFSSTGGVEGVWALASGSLVSISEQQLVDCSRNGNQGCLGGWQDAAFTFYETEAISTEVSYPYTASDGDCQGGWDVAIPLGGVTGYKDVNGEDDLKNAVSTVGPVSVAVDANSFQHYSSGVITSGCGTSLDHGVLVVGYGSMDGIPYWKVKNSWGTSWGEAGFVYIQRGVDMCGIGRHPSYPTVDSSVPPSPAPPPTPPTPSLDSLELDDAEGIVLTVALSDDSKFLASGSSDNKTRVYELQGFRDPLQVYTLGEATDDVNSVAISPNSKLLASGSHDNKVQLYALQEGSKPIHFHTLEDSTSEVWSVAFSPDSNLLATASCDHNVRIYSVAWGEKPSLLYTLNESTSCVQSVAFSADSKFLATGAWDYKVRVYALEEGSKPTFLHSLEGDGMSVSVAFSADSKLLASGSDDGLVHVFNMNSPQNFTLDEAFDAVTSVAFCDSKLASGSWDGYVRVYGLGEWAKPHLMYKLEESTDWVSAVAFSADAKFLATGSYDYKLRLYSLDPSGIVVSV